MSVFRHMWFPKWLAPKRHRPARRSAGLKVQILEDRTVPTTITVTSTAASGAGSLAAAITSLNTTPGTNDTILFSNTASGGATNFYSGAHTITVSGGLPIITDSIDIVGPGQSNLAIDADFNGRAFTIYKTASTPALVETLSGMTIENGNIGGPTPTADPSGGGVSFDGTHQTGDTLTISDCDITNNTLLADGGDAKGGGVFANNVDLTMGNSTVDHNTASYASSTQGYAFGGGIYMSAATGLTMTNSTLSDNTAQGGPGSFLAGSATAGGIYYDGDAVTLTGVTVTGNSALGGNASTTAYGNVGGGDAIGGGLWFTIQDDQQFTMLYSTVSFNQAVGGSATGPGPDTFPPDYGIAGGIATDGGMSVTAESGGSETDLGYALGSTFDDNSAVGGTATLTNTHVGSNTLAAAFGGIAKTGGVTVEQMAQCTVYNNSAQGGSASALDTAYYLSVGGTAIAGGFGRSFFSYGFSPATFYAYNSTFALNTATGGTASNYGFSPMQALGYGGGVGDVPSTYTGGIPTSASSIDVYSTIIASNTTSPAATSTSVVGPDIYGGVSLDNNLIGYGDASNHAAFPQGMFGMGPDPAPNGNYDIVGPNSSVDPIADVGFDNVAGVPRLADNHGPTFTVALLTGGVAVDMGSNGQSYPNDQRGFPYVRSSLYVPDIGAFELQSTPATPTVTYADTHWIGLPNGYQITDADPVASGNQPGAIGYNAFATITNAISHVASTGEVIVNGANGDPGSGMFNEDVAVNSNVTLHLQQGLVTVNSFAGNTSSATVTLAGISFSFGSANTDKEYDGTLTSTGGGTYDVTNVGTGIETFKGPVSYVTLAGTTTVNTGTFVATVSGSTDTFTHVTVDHTGSLTVAANGILDVDTFVSYGLVTVANGTSPNFTELVNTGTPVLTFGAGSVTNIGTIAGAPNRAVIDVNGHNALVTGTGTGSTTLAFMRNNGYVVDSSMAGTATVVSDGNNTIPAAWAIVKGAGYWQNSVITQNGGIFQAGNSPGTDFVGPFVLGWGGVSDYVFQIDDATGAAGPSADSEGHVDGWSLVHSDSLTWTADATHKLTVDLETLANPATVGTDVGGAMDNFDPTQSYSWAAVTWTGTYSGPTDDADLNAATVFDTSAFANSFSGTFGWHLDTAAKTLYLRYTPA